MARKITLTRGKHTLVDSEDYDYLCQWVWRFHGGYARRWAREHGTIHMHRLIINCPDNFEVDHINRDKLDNRKANLRVVTRVQNMWNKDAYKDSVSEYKGVSWHKKDKRWHAQIRLYGKLRFLGGYENEKTAAAAYNYYAKKYFGKYAVLNDVPDIDFRKERVLKAKGASKFRGVTYNKRHSYWVARITVDGKRLWLGCFETEVEAALAYNCAFIKFRPDKEVPNAI